MRQLTRTAILAETKVQPETHCQIPAVDRPKRTVPQCFTYMAQLAHRPKNGQPHLVAQTFVCAAPTAPKQKQVSSRRTKLLPNLPQKQQTNATSPALLGDARVSKAEDQDTAPQIEALHAAGCQRVYEERVSGGRWDRPELHRLLDRLAPGD